MQIPNPNYRNNKRHTKHSPVIIPNSFLTQDPTSYLRLPIHDSFSKFLPFSSQPYFLFIIYYLLTLLSLPSRLFFLILLPFPFPFLFPFLFPKSPSPTKLKTFKVFTQKHSSIHPSIHPSVHQSILHFNHLPLSLLSISLFVFGFSISTNNLLLLLFFSLFFLLSSIFS
ncbi:hypothetical protein EYC84_010898 [Monilinia fructicola]|uniref:Uncharacterized protein n=1 Tax=Monilinia fructicola TaxID=38448 RepID=A0A5M9JBB0_MONFR|nr:hypothetical protein EYC84_010898 [Monilinia fructicola]